MQEVVMVILIHIISAPDLTSGRWICYWEKFLKQLTINI